MISPFLKYAKEMSCNSSWKVLFFHDICTLIIHVYLMGAVILASFERRLLVRDFRHFLVLFVQYMMFLLSINVVDWLEMHLVSLRPLLSYAYNLHILSTLLLPIFQKLSLLLLCVLGLLLLDNLASDPTRHLVCSQSFPFSLKEQPNVFRGDRMYRH